MGLDYHASLDDTSLNTSYGNRANTTNLVHILKRKAKGFLGRTAGGFDGIDGLQESLASGLGLGLLLPSLVPWAIFGLLDHVVAVEARDGDERNGLGIVADLLDEAGDFFNDLVITIAGPLGRGSVHLVEGNYELLDTKSVGKKGVLASLSILGDTSFEFTNTSGDNEDSAVGLRGTSDHVLDKVTVTRGICRRASALSMTW